MAFFPEGIRFVYTGQGFEGLVDLQHVEVPVHQPHAHRGGLENLVQLGIGPVQFPLHFLSFREVEKGFQEVFSSVVIHAGDTLQNRQLPSCCSQQDAFGQVDRLPLIQNRAVADLGRAEVLVADLVLYESFGTSDQFEGVGVGPADPAAYRIHQHDSRRVVLENPGQLFFPFRQRGFRAPPGIDASLGVHAEEDYEEGYEPPFPELVHIGREQMVQKIAAAENGDVHQRFQKPVRKAESDADPYEILGQYRRFRGAQFPHALSSLKQRGWLRTGNVFHACLEYNLFPGQGSTKRGDSVPIRQHANRTIRGKASMRGRDGPLPTSHPPQECVMAHRVPLFHVS